MQKLKYTGLGMPSFLANVSAAGTVSNTQTATGSTSQANSFAITDDVTIFTTAASGTGARLPLAGSPGEGPNAGDIFFIANLDGNTLLIYPPTGGVINGGSSNASINLTTKKSGLFICIDGTNYLGITSAV